jgi:hypothetical protein
LRINQGTCNLVAAGGADGIADCPSVQVFYQNFTFFCDDVRFKGLRRKFIDARTKAEFIHTLQALRTDYAAIYKTKCAELGLYQRTLPQTGIEWLQNIQGHHRPDGQ